jgi:hypothetical protein
MRLNIALPFKCNRATAACDEVVNWTIAVSRRSWKHLTRNTLPNTPNNVNNWSGVVINGNLFTNITLPGPPPTNGIWTDGDDDAIATGGIYGADDGNDNDGADGTGMTGDEESVTADDGDDNDGINVIDGLIGYDVDPDVIVYYSQTQRYASGYGMKEIVTW